MDHLAPCLPYCPNMQQLVSKSPLWVWGSQECLIVTMQLSNVFAVSIENVPCWSTPFTRSFLIHLSLPSHYANMHFLMNLLPSKRQDCGSSLALQIHSRTGICVPYFLSKSFCPSNLGFFPPGQLPQLLLWGALVIREDITLLPPFVGSPKHLYHVWEPFQAPRRLLQSASPCHRVELDNILGKLESSHWPGNRVQNLECSILSTRFVLQSLSSSSKGLRRRWV